MKKKCVVCGKKAKRLCKNKDNTFVCSKCCAETRDAACDGCRYYEQAEHYSAEKMRKSHYREFREQIDPEVDRRAYRVFQLLDEGKLTQAEPVVNKLLHDHPDAYVTHYAAGLVHSLQESHEQALACFDKALELFPYAEEVWFNKAIAHKHMLQVADVVKAFRKVVEYGDQEDVFWPQARDHLREIEEMVESEGLSVSEYLHAADLFDKAFAHMSSKNWDQAVTGFQQVLQMQPTHVQAHGNMGICYGYLGERAKAVESLNKALELDPEYELARHNLKSLEQLPEGERFSDQNATLAQTNFYAEQVREE